MRIRVFEPGDEASQVAIYNEAASALPRFKPTTLAEVRRRTTASDFDPTTRLYLIDKDQPVGYATLSTTGRIGFPWCRPGHEAHAEPLFAATLEALRARGITTAWAAYRADWKPQQEFFEAHGFTIRRRMLNFTMPLLDMPTPSGRAPRTTSLLRKEDLPDLLALAPGLLRLRDVAALEAHLFRNPYFTPESTFVLRDTTGRVRAAATLVNEPTYPTPDMIDANMPCFRLGTWGTEGLTHKRVQGQFSVLVPAGPDSQRLALDLLNLAAERLANDDVEALASQVSDDHEPLVRFYRSYFRQQGSFPLYERDI